MFLLDREAFRITRRLVGWILQQNVQSHNIQYALRHVQKPFAKSAIHQNKAVIDVFMRGESYPLVLILVRILNQVAPDFGIPINPLIQNWGL